MRIRSYFSEYHLGSCIIICIDNISNTCIKIYTALYNATREYALSTCWLVLYKRYLSVFITDSQKVGDTPKMFMLKNKKIQRTGKMTVHIQARTQDRIWMAMPQFVPEHLIGVMPLSCHSSHMGMLYLHLPAIFIGSLQRN